MSLKVKQRDVSDCGAACLASVAEYYKLKLPIPMMRRLAGTEKNGTSMSGVVSAAKKLGFDVKGVKTNLESLAGLPCPMIAHVIINKELLHFVVVYKVSKKKVKVMDPSTGEYVTFTHDVFSEIWTGALILLIPGIEFSSGNKKSTIFNRYWGVLRGHKGMLAQALFGAAIYTILGFGTSIYIQKIVDFVFVDDNNGNLLNLMSVGMVIIIAIQVAIGMGRSIFGLKVGQQMDAKLILGYYKHLLKLPQDFFDTMRVGEIISRINDAFKIRTFLNDVSINFLVNIFVIISAFCLMFTYYWKLAVMVSVSIPLFYLIYFITNSINRKVQRKMMEHAASLESQLVESLNAVSTIKQFGIEDFTNSKTERKFFTLLSTGYKSGISYIYINSSTDLLSHLLTIVLLWVGATYVSKNIISPGELLSFYTLIGFFTTSTTSLIGMNKMMQDASIASDRLFEIMDIEPEREDTSIELTNEKIGDIHFENVHFAYRTRAKIFNGLTLSIPKGRLTVILGESGSGKSTLMALLQNVYTIQEGRILIGKFDLKYLDNFSLRNKVAIVPQQIHLFAGNVLENIALGDDNPNFEKVIDITSKLGILNFIEALPNGFKTDIGENGTALSGGQRQRIAIARALYKDPQILILDEATSSLDINSEKYVQAVIEDLKAANKTIIVITHKVLSSVGADKAILIDKGNVIEEGHPEELLKAQSFYYSLYNQQFHQNMN
ncbi:ATP-binding cassette subfamily B protein [Mucilaginibacter rubeus]|uniref:peptidase domain-containing ABC transporter n=1 Tax=Mucilaginibacter rubeus TaxID=2027860 RepID=UPI0033920E90